MVSQVSVALLGLDGFAVVGVEQIDGEVHIGVESDGTHPVGCPVCGVVPAPGALKDRSTVQVRDLPVSGRPTVLCWSKRRWRCVEPVCPRGSFTEAHPAVRPRQVLTERARTEICRLVGEDAVAVAKVAREFGVGWHTAWKAVLDHGRPKVDDPDRTATVASLGVDETAWLTATRDHHTRFVSGLVDLGTGRLLDVVADRTITTVAGWLAAQPQGWLAGIGVVACDPYRGYATAMASQIPGATMVVDHFHVARLGNTAVEDRPPPHPTGHHRAPGPQSRSVVPDPQTVDHGLRSARHPRMGTTGRRTPGR